MLTTLAPKSNNPFHPLRDLERHLPCGDISHHAPLFFPTLCHHANKVLVADLEEGTGMLIHAGSARNAAFALWPLKQEVLRAVQRGSEGREEGEVEFVERSEVGMGEGEEDREATSLSVFLGKERESDAEWEFVERPAVVKEKFVLVGKRRPGSGDVEFVKQPRCVGSA